MLLLQFISIVIKVRIFPQRIQTMELVQNINAGSVLPSFQLELFVSRPEHLLGFVRCDDEVALPDQVLPSRVDFWSRHTGIL